MLRIVFSAEHRNSAACIFNLSHFQLSLPKTEVKLFQAFLLYKCFWFILFSFGCQFVVSFFYSHLSFGMQKFSVKLWREWIPYPIAVSYFNECTFAQFTFDEVIFDESIINCLNIQSSCLITVFYLIAI